MANPPVNEPSWANPEFRRGTVLSNRSAKLREIHREGVAEHTLTRERCGTQAQHRVHPWDRTVRLDVDRDVAFLAIQGPDFSSLPRSDLVWSPIAARRQRSPSACIVVQNVPRACSPWVSSSVSTMVAASLASPLSVGVSLCFSAGSRSAASGPRPVRLPSNSSVQRLKTVVTRRSQTGCASTLSSSYSACAAARLPRSCGTARCASLLQILRGPRSLQALRGRSQRCPRCGARCGHIPFRLPARWSPWPRGALV